MSTDAAVVNSSADRGAAAACPQRPRNPIFMQVADAPTMTPGGVLVQDMPGEWWAIRIRGGVEKSFARGLNKRGIDNFLPLYREFRRKVPVYRAAVPGYIFVAGGEVEISHASEQRDFAGFVRECLNAETRARLRDDLINLQKFLTAAMGDESDVGPSRRPGDRVIVISGTFEGIRGTYASYKGKGRLIVDLDLLGCGCATDIDESEIEFV